jgi:hypothetical protein
MISFCALEFSIRIKFVQKKKIYFGKFISLKKKKKKKEPNMFATNWLTLIIIIDSETGGMRSTFLVNFIQKSQY